MGWGVRAILAIAHAVAAWPGAVVAIPSMPAWGLLLAAGGLIWLCVWRTRLRLAALPALLAGCAAPWLATQPDLVVSPDAQLIAIRTADGIFVHANKGASLFDREDPARIWGATQTAPLPARDDCTQAACRLLVGNASVALLLSPTAGCPAAALVIASVANSPPCNAPLLLDAASLRQSGAVAAYFGAAGITMVTDAGLRGARPWVVAPAEAVRARSGLPPALTE
jgi:competence protein ComEC